MPEFSYARPSSKIRSSAVASASGQRVASRAAAASRSRAVGGREAVSGRGEEAMRPRRRPGLKPWPPRDQRASSSRTADLAKLLVGRTWLAVYELPLICRNSPLNDPRAKYGASRVASADGQRVASRAAAASRSRAVGGQEAISGRGEEAMRPRRRPGLKPRPPRGHEGGGMVGVCFSTSSDQGAQIAVSGPQRDSYSH